MSSKQRYIVNAGPVHPNGKPFRRSLEIAGGSLFLETHWSAESCRVTARKLLQHCGLDPAGMYLR
ncbi:MAG: hypothetical protein OXG37_04785, partial [Actinomycetia bacterium]|nr:hypothetical protein [Actinomycetes bacterium]